MCVDDLDGMWSRDTDVWHNLLKPSTKERTTFGR